MPVFDPNDLAKWTNGKWTLPPSIPLTGFCHDTRELTPGQVFVAIKTDKRDGHDFIPSAVGLGAGAAIVSRPNTRTFLPQLVVADPLEAFQTIAREQRRQFKGPVIGISGSAGKTSTKNLLALLLGGEAGGVMATAGNLNNHLGVPLTLTRLDPKRHQFAVIEAGISGSGEMAPLAQMIEPDVAIITLVAPAHVEALGSLDGVAREKAVLTAAVRPNGIAVFPKQCADFPSFRDLNVRKLVIESADVIRPAEPPKDRVYYAITHRGDKTVIAVAYGAPPPLHFTIRRMSDGMARNAVLSICAALWLGVSSEDVQARLAQWQPAPLRGEIRVEPGRLLYLDCYNANPASMSDAIEAFQSVASDDQPRLYIIGGMEELGPKAADYHHQLGKSLRLRADDYLFTIGSHADSVRDGLLANENRPDQVEVVTDLAPVAAKIAHFSGAVFVKGSRRYQLERILEAEVPVTSGAH